MEVLRVLKTLDRAGYRSWLVGGAVRDALLHDLREPDDLDVATPARPELVMRLFPRTIPTGIDHGTVTVLSGRRALEVTTFRGEGAYVDGRRPSSVTFLSDVDEDLARRDFTVNAMAWDPLHGEFRDPFDGRTDLRRGILRAVGNAAARFAEDGLRPVRAARFVAQLGFSVDDATAAAIPGARATAARVAVERTMEELAKLLLGRHVGRGLELLDATGLLEVVLPDVAAVAPAARRHAFAVTAAVDAELARRLAALLHVIAPRDAARDRVGGVLTTLRSSRGVRDGAAALASDHRCLAAADPGPVPAGAVQVRRWLSRVGVDRAEALVALWRAEVRSMSDRRRAAEERARLRAFTAGLERVRQAKPPLAFTDLALDGRAVMSTLKIPAGPEVGDALRHLLDRVLVEPSLNTRARLTSVLHEWWARRSGKTAAVLPRVHGTRSGGRPSDGQTR